MRADMAKVVTERPRSGSSNSSLKTGGRIAVREFADDDRWDDDNRGSRHPISRYRQHSWDAKSFTDVIGPLRACLRKQVGRPWNDVYSELSAVLDKRSISGQHIWTHVFQEVETHAIVLKGRCFHRLRFGMFVPVVGLFVDPVTGILRYERDRRPHYRAKVDPNIVKIDPLHELERIEGIWYLHTYHMIPKVVVTYSPCARCAPTKLMNFLGIRKPSTPESIYSHVANHGHEWKGTSYTKMTEERKLLAKHQLNHKELRTHGKVNEVTVYPISRRAMHRMNA
jgi:hypothetical protein